MTVHTFRNTLSMIRAFLASDNWTKLMLLGGFANIIGMLVWLFLAGWLQINLHLP